MEISPTGNVGDLAAVRQTEDETRNILELNQKLQQVESKDSQGNEGKDEEETQGLEGLKSLLGTEDTENSTGQKIDTFA